MKKHNSSDFYELAKEISISENPNFDLAGKYLATASSDGDHRAIYALATWHLFGRGGFEVDPRKAVFLLKSISHGWIAEAIFDLAYCYDIGAGVRRNEKVAFQYYTKAAMLGDPESCLQLSQFYAEGRIVPYNKFLSAAWKERSKHEPDEISPSYRMWI